MKIELRGEWRRTLEEAEADKKQLVELFGEVNAGVTSIKLCDHREWRATHTVTLTQITKSLTN